MKRTALKRRTPLAKRSATNSRPPKQPVRVHPEARARALSRSGGICVVCAWRIGLDVRNAPERRLRELLAAGTIRSSRILHHVLPKQKWPHLAEEEDNLVCACKPCHDAHEFQPGGRMSRRALPQVSIDLAEREGLSWYIDEVYAA